QKYHVNIEHMPSGIDSFSIVTDSKQVKGCYFDLIGEINNLKDVLRVDVENDIAVIAVVGRNMGDKPGIAGFLFNALGKESINIKIIAQASLELSIIIAVENKDFNKTINTIYLNFIEKI
ncbi:MAG: ACT domain-containing protein, partial [Candidatus Izemoplasma sp.]